MAKDPSSKLLLKAEIGTLSYLVKQKYTINPSLMSKSKKQIDTNE